MDHTYDAFVREEAFGEGAAAGQLHAARQMIRLFIEARFGRVPEWVVWRLDTCNNFELLREAARHVASFGSLEDLGLPDLSGAAPLVRNATGQTAAGVLWDMAWAKGYREGALAALRDAFLSLLERRFGTRSQPVVGQVESTTEIGRLREAVLHAASVSSLDDLRL